jgi:hypothetical protein
MKVTISNPNGNVWLLKIGQASKTLYTTEERAYKIYKALTIIASGIENIDRWEMAIITDMLGELENDG